MKEQTAAATKPTTEKPPKKIKGTREFNEQAGTLWVVEHDDPHCLHEGKSPPDMWKYSDLASGCRSLYQLRTKDDAFEEAKRRAFYDLLAGRACRYRIRNVITRTAKRVNVRVKVTTTPARAVYAPVEFEHSPKKGRFYVLGEHNRCITHEEASQCSNQCVRVRLWSFIDVPASRNSARYSSTSQIEFQGHQVAGYGTMRGAVEAVEWLDRHKVQANILDDQTGRLIRYGVIIGQGRMLGNMSKNGLRIKAVAEPWLQTLCADVWVA